MMNFRAEELLHLVYEFQLKDSHLTVSHVRFAFPAEKFFGQRCHSAAINCEKKASHHHRRKRYNYWIYREIVTGFISFNLQIFFPNKLLKMMNFGDKFFQCLFRTVFITLLLLIILKFLKWMYLFVLKWIELLFLTSIWRFKSLIVRCRSLVFFL